MNPHSDLPAQLQDLGLPSGPGTTRALLAVGAPYGSETPAMAAGEPPAPEYLLPLEVLLSFRPCTPDFRAVSALCPDGIPVSEAAIPGLVATEVCPWFASEVMMSDAGQEAVRTAVYAWRGAHDADDEYSVPWWRALWTATLAELRLDLADPSRGGPLQVGADGRTLERRRW